MLANVFRLWQILWLTFVQNGSKIVLSGEPDISSPLAFAEGLFYFCILLKKEGFLKDLSYYVIRKA